MLIAGNWKMYKGPAETAEFCVELKRRLAELEGVDSAPKLSGQTSRLVGQAHINALVEVVEGHVSKILLGARGRASIPQELRGQGFGEDWGRWSVTSQAGQERREGFPVLEHPPSR